MRGGGLLRTNSKVLSASQKKREESDAATRVLVMSLTDLDTTKPPEIKLEDDRYLGERYPPPLPRFFHRFLVFLRNFHRSRFLCSMTSSQDL